MYFFTKLSNQAILQEDEKLALFLIFCNGHLYTPVSRLAKVYGHIEGFIGYEMLINKVEHFPLLF